MDNNFKIPWKNGNILVMGHWLFIFCETKMTDYGLAHEHHTIIYHALCSMEERNAGEASYVSLGKSAGIGYMDDLDTGVPRTDIRIATNMEKEFLFEQLEHNGVMWDEKNLQLCYKDGRPYPGRV